MIALYRSMVEDLLLSLHYRSSLHRSVQAIAFGVLAIPLTLAVHRFDRRISTRGLSRAASALLRHYYSGLVSDPALRVFLQAAESRRNAAGAGRIFTANHPGVGDGLACLAVIGSKNLRILVRQRKLFDFMPGISRYCIIVDRNGRPDIAGIREAERWLSAGGDLLMFPAGSIEPDPDFPMGLDSKPWSRLPELLRRRLGSHPEDTEANGPEIIPLRISSVYQPRFFRHWFVRAAKTPQERSWRAACMTVLLPQKPRPVIRIQAASAKG
jgi:hypothetical protein